MAYKKLNRTVRYFTVVCGLGLLVSQFSYAQDAAVDVSGVSKLAQPQFDQWSFRAQSNEELYIPPAIDRPLGEDDGPRIDVASIGLDIDPALQQKMDAELEQSLSLMLTGRVAENSAQGFTIGRLENVAVTVTNTMRSSGFILAYAYLPEQSIMDGVVRISVLPGSLDSITVDGNNRYSTQRLLGPFSDLMGSPVEKASIENSIMHLRDYPGLNTTAVFSPGSSTGTSELTLRVTEDPFDISFVADNHGTQSTGESRIRSDLEFHNIFGRADTLTALVLQTFDPASNTYGGIAYETPIVRHDWSLGLGYSKNSFDVTGGTVGLLDIGGDTDISNLFIKKSLKRTRRASVDLAFDLSVKSAVLENLPAPTEDNVSTLSLDLGVEAVDNLGAGGINQLQVRYSQGLADFLGSMDEFGLSSNGARSTRRGGSGDLAGGDFGKAMLRYQRLQRISQSNSLLLRVEGQETSDALVSLEQFVMGGPNSVRAYPIAEYLTDNGVFASLEWIVDLDQLSGKGGGDTDVSVSFFGDYASGELNDPSTGQDVDPDLSGGGIGFTIRHTGANGNQFSLRIDAAAPIGSDIATNGRDPQYYGAIGYSFR